MSTVNYKSGLKLLLLNAASTELDDQHRIGGSLDVPLSARGQLEADALGRLLADNDLGVIYSATCAAARETAQRIGKHHRLRIRVVESWKNLDHGLWHGKCVEELKENHARFYRQWCEHPDTVAPPGGETYTEVKSRIEPALRRICRKHASGTALIVAPDPLLCILRGMIAGLHAEFGCEASAACAKTAPASISQLAGPNSFVG